MIRLRRRPPARSALLSNALFGIALAASGLASHSGGALAHDYTAGALKIAHPWSRATPGGAKVAGGYLSVTNTGAEPDRLTGASLSEAGSASVHSMSMEGGVMKMAPVPDGLAIPPGKTLALEPGGYHLMFEGLRAPLKKGDRVKGTLTFERAGTVPVEFAVEGIGARAPGAEGGEAAGHGGHGHGHGH